MEDENNIENNEDYNVNAKTESLTEIEGFPIELDDLKI